MQSYFPSDFFPGGLPGYQSSLLCWTHKLPPDGHLHHLHHQHYLQQQQHKQLHGYQSFLQGRLINISIVMMITTNKLTTNKLTPSSKLSK